MLCSALKVLSRALKCFKSVEQGSVVLESGEKCSAYNLSKHCSDIAARPAGMPLGLFYVLVA